ncbi:peptidase M48, Ste24p [Roseibium sp. TrichSKD4]|uniref:hypothetical protein n=1 Tax=Roseibium sp. TrichSKD4 TaxID=744980 RepID=UPI0001E5666F|nr:hypothetical protein [Roseibium sp. TrichSKD4]EFO33595.1 peptidase M48, Ste24p [Roseibium sp. TrichSKD4]
MDIEQHLGAKVSVMIAGLIGSIVSLTFMRDLTAGRAFLYIVTGTACAIYGTPIVVKWMGITEPIENGAAFLTGLVGMNVLAGLFKISERFRHEPIKTLHSIKGVQQPPAKENKVKDGKDD